MIGVIIIKVGTHVGSMIQRLKRLQRPDARLALKMPSVLNQVGVTCGIGWSQILTISANVKLVSRVMDSVRLLILKVWILFYFFINNPSSYCYDIDECDGGFHLCSNAWCENIEGSYNCNCNEGYVSSEYDTNDTNCYDIDECQDHYVCHEEAICINVIGSYIGMRNLFTID